MTPLAVIITLIVIVGAITIFARIVAWWDSLYTPYGPINYSPKKTYTPPVLPLAKKPAFEKPITINHYNSYAFEVRNPPRATFFSRVDGVEYKYEGPYETDYISLYDKRIWDEKQNNIKAVKPLISQQLKDINSTIPPDNKEQKDIM